MYNFLRLIINLSIIFILQVGQLCSLVYLLVKVLAKFVKFLRLGLKVQQRKIDFTVFQYLLIRIILNYFLQRLSLIIKFVNNNQLTYMDYQHQKLRLKVCTNTGLNIMCTVNKDWTVEKLYPHITSLYKEVTEDQGGNHVSVHITTLKRNSYFIPKSQIVGQIFNDGDEVTCNVQVRTSKGGNSKKQKKDEKRNQKSQQKKKEQSQKQVSHKKKDQKRQKSQEEEKSSKKAEKNKSRQKHNENKQSIKVKQNQEQSDQKGEAKKKKNRNKKPRDHESQKKELKVPRQQLMKLFQSQKQQKKLNKQKKSQQDASQNQVHQDGD